MKLAEGSRTEHCFMDKPCLGRARSEPGGTRWRTRGEVKGKLANGVGSQYSYATSERGISSITQADAHTSAASSRLNWRPQPILMDSSVSGKDEIWFLRVCHHVPHELLQTTRRDCQMQPFCHVWMIFCSDLYRNCTNLFVFGATALLWARSSSFTKFLDHTQRRTTVGRTPL